EVARISFISLKLNLSFTASALTMPSRIRSWMSWSSPGAAAGARVFFDTGLPPATRRRDPKALSAAMLPRDLTSEQDVQSAEPGAEQQPRPAQRQRERHTAQRHERIAHQRDHAHRKTPARDNGGPV